MIFVDCRKYVSLMVASNARVSSPVAGIYFLLLLCFLVLAFPLQATSEPSLSYLNDKDGDGVVRFLGFGDSITYGIGDADNPLDEGEDEIRDVTGRPSGYVSRLFALLGIEGANGGVPGEVFTEAGSARLPRILATSNADVVGFLVGANDAILQVSQGQYRRALQRGLNLVRSRKKQAILISPLPTCCDRQLLRPFVEGYGAINADLATVNVVPLAQVNEAWNRVCPPGGTSCRFYNLPEGLHPNARGYRLISHVVGATLLGINILDPSGPEELADAAGIERTDIDL
jgi:lysophospholipase L1-like esterase